MLELLPELLDRLDEPFGDASVLPTYLLSRFTRRHVTVALGGDGADELLAGYPTFGADRLARMYRVPAILHRNVVVPLVERLPVDTRNFSFDFKAKRFVRGLPYDDDIRHSVWLGAFTPEEQRSLLRSPASDPLAPARTSASRAPVDDAVARLCYLYVDGYLQDDILTKVDRASMAASLEVRAPFLDVELVDFLGRVPSHLKLRRRETKWLLKEAMRGIVPAEVAKRPKKGFGVPIAAWFRDGLREELLDTLSPQRIRAQGLLNAAEVERLVSEHLAGAKDHRKQLWTLFCLQRWCDNYASAPAVPAPVVVAPSR
jgi:asparagine synthase (glutamine-hydrolysing)